MESGPAPTLVCYIVLIGLAPLIVTLFAVGLARRAMVLGAIFAAVLLPPVSIDLPGLPPLDRFMAASIGILTGTLLFDIRRLLSFRLRWFDLPILLFCMCPYASAISNDLGPYDGLSAAFRQFVVWGFPYLIGRLYLTDAEGFRELATGMIVSAVCLIPFCFLEMRIGPQLQGLVYGTGGWEGTRDGGFRPRLFFQSGLALGLWISTATLLAWWLWRRSGFRSLWGLPSGVVIVPALAITSILCRARGATFLGITGWFTLWSCTRFRSKWVIWGLLAIAPTYYFVRTTKLWTGNNLVELLDTYVSKERAQSIGARFGEEDVIIVRALKRPIFGWGGYSRARIVEDEITDPGVPVSYDDDGVRYLEFVDSFWSIILGDQGFTGLILMTIAMTLPVILFLVRFPVGQWGHPSLAPVAAMAVILSLFLIDGLSNAMPNPIYFMIAGGLGSLVPARFGARASARSARVRMASGGRDEPDVGVATGPLVSDDDPAARYQSLGRAAKDRGRLDEAEAAWQHALDLLTEWLTAHPEHPALRRRWCDCANDLAWLLAGAADAAGRDPAGAVALAAKTAEMDPECSTYWNTLGAVHYRAGDFRAAIADLDRAIALSQGGTAFDHVFLAMAHAQSGDAEGARRWFDLTIVEMGQDPPGRAELCRLCEEAGSLLSSSSDAVAAP